MQFVGKPFRRQVDLEMQGGKSPLEVKRVRIVGFVSVATGEIVFRPASKTPYTVSDLPHIPLKKADSMHDFAYTPKSLSNVRKGKGGASTRGIDMDEIYRSRGATNTEDPIPKRAGFGSNAEMQKVNQIRKNRKAIV